MNTWHGCDVYGRKITGRGGTINQQEKVIRYLRGVPTSKTDLERASQINTCGDELAIIIVGRGPANSQVGDSANFLLKGGDGDFPSCQVQGPVIIKNSPPANDLRPGRLDGKSCPRLIVDNASVIDHYEVGFVPYFCSGIIESTISEVDYLRTAEVSKVGGDGRAAARHLSGNPVNRTSCQVTSTGQSPSIHVQDAREDSDSGAQVQRAVVCEVGGAGKCIPACGNYSPIRILPPQILAGDGNNRWPVSSYRL